MMAIWDALLNLLTQTLVFLHDAVEPFAGAAAWGWGVVLLTVVVRIFLLPLAIKQTRSMRAMQKLQPEMKKIQAKFKVDRGLMRSNPEKYKEQKAKQQEAMMALYKDNNVNPAASCLPLLLQMPIFFALYRVLINTGKLPDLQEASFYIFGSLSTPPRLATGSAILGTYLLILGMGATTFLSQKQMMSHTPASQQMQQQKVLLYVMPVMLMVFAYNFPVGVLLYWVTTNVWTMGQQWVMFRQVEQPVVAASETGSAERTGKDAAAGRDDGATPPASGDAKQKSKEGGTTKGGSAGARGAAGKPRSKSSKQRPKSKRKAG